MAPVELVTSVPLCHFQEYIGSAEARVPDMDGILHIKSEGRKIWKKHYVVLRASGVYFNPKGKTKVRLGAGAGMTNQFLSATDTGILQGLRLTDRSSPVSLADKLSFPIIFKLLKKPSFII